MSLPVFIFKHTKLSSMSGSIVLPVHCKTGMIKIGIHGVGIIDNTYERTIWQCKGKVIFKGTANIGSGTKFSINKGGSLTLGDKFCITGRSTIICSKNVTFGNECLLSWDILIMDTDFHNIYTIEDLLMNSPKPILIGNHVWIGCRNTILKGVSIADNVIVAAGSLLTKKVLDAKCIVGTQNTICHIKDNITWSI